MVKMHWYPLIIVAFLLLGCQSSPQKTAAESTVQGVGQPARSAGHQADLPFAVSQASPRELTSDIIFSYLAGEIGAHRGKFAASYQHYLRAATLAHDPYAAERATRIAAHNKDYPAALRAVRRWVELDPNAIKARQTAVLLFMRQGLTEEAYTQLQAMIQITEAKGGDGFILAASLLAKGDHVRSGLVLMKRLVSDHAPDVRARYAQAILELAAKDLGASELSLRDVIGRKSDHFKARILLSQVMVELDRAADAAEEIRAALKDYPQEAELRRTYARLLISLKQYPEALRQFQSVLEQTPEDVDTLYAVGMLTMETKDWNASRDVWQRLRTLGKRHNEATYFLAQVEEAAGHKEKAKLLYSKMAQGKLHAEAWLHLARLQAETGNPGQARETLQRLRILEPGRAIEAYLIEAQIFQDLNDSETAIAIYAAALEAHPDNIDLLYSRALYVVELGHVDWLERDLKKVLATDPDHADALNALGYTLADRTDRYEEAFVYISKAYRLKPDNPAVLDSMGWVHYRLKDYAKALEFLRKAIEFMQDAEIAAHLGEVLWVSGDQGAADRVWDEALSADPDSEILRAVIGRFKESR